MINLVLRNACYRKYHQVHAREGAGMGACACNSENVAVDVRDSGKGSSKGKI